MLGICSSSFNPQRDIPPLEGKVILVTGANVGLGKQSVLEFARHKPKEIWLAARNAEKAQAAVDEIKKQILQLDLASFESIKKAAKTFLNASDRLDILMLNAGIMAVDPGLTKDGYEVQFGTNHLGHALLAKLLLPVLEKTTRNTPNADVRVISLSSYGHTSWPKGGFRFDLLKSPASELGSYHCYYQSKLANILWARQFAKEHPQFTVASVHPGVVRTELMNRATGTPRAVRAFVTLVTPLLASVEQGAKGQLWASVSKDVKSGEYYEPVGVAGKGSDDSKNDRLAKELWDWTEGELVIIGLKGVHVVYL
ncbi:hypothetical protein QBC34DRAFT_484492 [Podospora aff. communis PSN243]|uniref:Oxidoreductase n=1 Tax=Podospora aff. communis PSN243 TaxID=3040156 RepID=A0AAV9GUF3_9PEZI|nr:hypothetical protein QBC34DRAFT_484492 [Podospora aff. communis PSN243]